MKILVTGGQGFIGRALIKNLLENNHSVTSIDRTPNKTLQFTNCEYIPLNILDIDSLEGSDYDICYHLAAVNLDKVKSFLEPQETFNTNLQGTERIATWCIRYNVRMIYAGSSSTVFNRNQSPYTFTKAVAEELLRTYQSFFNLKLNIATIYNVYGTCKVTNKEASKVLHVWNTFLKNKKITIYGSGKQHKDFIHVDDVATALTMLVTAPNNLENWHLGSGNSYSINEIYRFYKEEIKDLEVERVDVDNVDNSFHSLVNKNFFKTFNWEPKISLPNYIKSTLVNVDT